MNALDLRNALGGDIISGRRVVAPGPGHRSPGDRSLSVWPDEGAPDGFRVHSFAGDDWRDCRDHVARRLGLSRDSWRNKLDRRPLQPPRRAVPTPVDGAHRTAEALSIWAASTDPRGTIAQIYLRQERSLELGDDLAGDVLRWHPGIGAMIALFRNIQTGEPQAISRTFLDREGKKLGRKFLGPVGGAAIMLDAFEDVLGGLHIGEGVETAMTARTARTARQRINLRPAWALGSAGAIAAFPVLGGVECLTLLKEHDEASARAVEACAARWHAAGREVLISLPIGGKDLNDVIRRNL